MAMTASHKDAI